MNIHADKLILWRHEAIRKEMMEAIPLVMRAALREAAEAVGINESTVDEFADLSTRLTMHYAYLKVYADKECVYLVQAGRSGPVKIGRARCLPSRLSSLQTSSYERLFVRGAFLGNSFKEKEAHRMYWKHRIRGEWFAYEGAIVDLVDNGGFEWRR